MSGKLDVHVSGRDVQVGNIVQGHGNTVISSGGDVRLDDRFARFQAGLPELARPFDRSEREIAALRAQVDALQAAAKAAEPDVAGGSRILATIRDHFGWAWPAVKALAQAAWPAVLAAIAG